MPSQTILEANRLKNERAVNFISVGIGDSINRAELNNMASDPDSEHSFQLASSADMEDVAGRILDTVCQ